MLHEASAQQASSPLVSILFRIFTAMHCGAVLLGKDKRILSLSETAQKHLGEALSTTKGRLCAMGRGVTPCSKPFWTSLSPHRARRSEPIPSCAMLAPLDCSVLTRTASMKADPVLGSLTVAHVNEHVHPAHERP